jgi:hypothetical protein
MKHLTLISLLSFAATSFSAASIVSYTFEGVTDPGLSGDDNSIVLTSASSDANVSDSGITGGGGLDVFRVRNPASAYDSFVLLTSDNADSANTAEALTNGAFFSFTVAPDSGYEMDLTSLDFLVARGGTTGDRTYEVRSSLTGTTSLAGPSVPVGVRSGGTSGMDSISIDLTGVSFQDLSSAVTFTFFSYEDTSGNLSLEWDDITLNGSVAAVPEPSTFAVFAGLMALGLVMWRRRLRD